MAAPPQQRVGSWSSLNFYEENNGFDTDPSPVAGYVLPLQAASGLKGVQNLVEVPVFKGDRRPFGQVLGPKQYQGKIPLNLEFTTIGRLFAVFFGRGGYSRPLAGTSSLHRFLIPSTAGAIPGSCQFEGVSAEATAVVHRGRGTRIQNVNFKLAPSGPAIYDIDAIGIGDFVTGSTTLGSSGTTLLDDGLVPTTYFNGSISIKGNNVQDLTGLSLSLMGNVTRTEVFGNSGIAGSLPTGNVQPKGSFEFMWTVTGTNEGADLVAWTDALNQTEIAIDCYWTDQPVAGPTFPTKYLRFFMPSVRLGAAHGVPGGMAGLKVQVPWGAARSITPNAAASSFPGQLSNFGTGGPYTLDATHFNLGVKVDGGATITVALTQSQQTAAQIVTTLNANGSFSAVAVASVFLGNYILIKSKQSSSYGANTSINIDSSVANSAHAVLGFTPSIAVAGVSNCEIYTELSNALGAAY